MKTKLIAVLLLVVGVNVGFAGNSESKDVVKEINKQKAYENLFHANEFNFDIYGVSDFKGITESSTVSAGLGLNYWITKNFGLGARIGADDFDGIGVEDSLGRILLRAPLWDRVAPYGYVEGGYNWQNEDWLTGLGAGVEFRIIEHLGIFGEAGVKMVVGEQQRDNLNGDLRLVFGIRYSY